MRLSQFMVVSKLFSCVYFIAVVCFVLVFVGFGALFCVLIFGFFCFAFFVFFFSLLLGCFVIVVVFFGGVGSETRYRFKVFQLYNTRFLFSVYNDEDLSLLCSCVYK